MAAVALGVAAIGAAGTAAAAPPAMAAPIKNDAWGMFDNSGWNVATSGARLTASDGSQLSDTARIAPWLVLAAVAVAGLKLWRK